MPRNYGSGPYGSGPYGGGFQPGIFAQTVYDQLNIDDLLSQFAEDLPTVQPYSGIVGAYNPALYWRLTDPVGSGTAFDSSGKSRTGIYGSGITLGQPGALASDPIDTSALFNNTANGVVSSDPKNLIINSSFETDTSNWVTNGGSIRRVIDDKMFGSACLEVTTTFAGGVNSGAAYNHPNVGAVPVTVGNTVSFSCYAKARKGYAGTLINMQINQQTAAHGFVAYNIGPDVALRDDAWQRVTVTVVIQATVAEAGLYINISDIYAGLDSVWLIEGVQFEVAPAPTAYVETYYPFVPGSQRTFMGWANKSSIADYDVLFYGISPTSPNLFMSPNNMDMDFRVIGNAAPDAYYTAAWPGLNQWAMWALTWDDAARRAELFINGQSLGAQVVSSSITTNSPFSIGAGGGSAFGGTMQEVAVFESILSAATIRSIYNASFAQAAPNTPASSMSDFIGALGYMFQQQDDLAHASVGTDGNPADQWTKLLDIDRIPDEGLPWFSQFTGVTLDPNRDIDDQRQQIRDRVGWKRGTRAAMTSALQPLLIGTQTVEFVERDTSPYHFLINTYSTETPNSAAVTAAIIANKPAGLQFTYTVTVGSPATADTYQNVFIDYATEALLYNQNTSYQDVYVNP